MGSTPTQEDVFDVSLVSSVPGESSFGLPAEDEITDRGRLRSRHGDGPRFHEGTGGRSPSGDRAAQEPPGRRTTRRAASGERASVTAGDEQSLPSGRPSPVPSEAEDPYDTA
ncbi:hypothetical protein BJF83_07210 [Nocardiopsis sp. CNR-923]|uniref:hypothetical protein n=1 Tax=Nocardiopsis sp. CNR-923 TaxID=1904965 RepID=UPI0009608760|nr:hypothetical protein [Nocardiopsis sp. CNR-923]OLT24256.1 hypothetical protein BJF83_07210 [Nocardiopsis sp. CNR-923]